MSGSTFPPEAMITTVLFLMSILLNNAEANATAPPGSKIILNIEKHISLLSMLLNHLPKVIHLNFLC